MLGHCHPAGRRRQGPFHYLCVWFGEVQPDDDSLMHHPPAESIKADAGLLELVEKTLFECRTQCCRGSVAHQRPSLPRACSIRRAALTSTASDRSRS